MNEKWKELKTIASIRFTWVLALFIISVIMIFNHEAGVILLKGAIDEFDPEGYQL